MPWLISMSARGMGRQWPMTYAHLIHLLPSPTPLPLHWLSKSQWRMVNLWTRVFTNNCNIYTFFLTMDLGQDTEHVQMGTILTVFALTCQFPVLLVFPQCHYPCHLNSEMQNMSPTGSLPTHCLNSLPSCDHSPIVLRQYDISSKQAVSK